MAETGYGICSGMARHKSRSGRETLAMCEWLHAQIQALAGLAPGEPLCFGDLWAASSRTAGRSRAEAFAELGAADEDPVQARRALRDGPRDVELVLVASDLNRGQSVQLPFLRDHGRFHFRKSDLGGLLPPEVVQWMVAHAPPIDLEGIELHGVAPDDFCRLPPPEDLPILFGTRLSLSFPFLFRSVRLYILRRRQAGDDELAEVWLTDGGITSNFPLHLFDSPIPNRPTFCLNLLYDADEFVPEPARTRGWQAGLEESDEEAEAGEAREAGAAGAAEAAAPAGGGEPEQLVYMLRTNYGRVSPYTRLASGGGFGGLVRYAFRVFDTARTWGDNQLLDVPGYRDRIVHIRMRTGEGGFSYDMAPQQIIDIQARGQRAGEVIARRFLPDAKDDPLHPGESLVLNWANHRMARFRSYLAGLELSAARFAAGWKVDFERAERLPSDPHYVAPSLYWMIDHERAAGGGSPYQPAGYPFRNAAQRNLAYEMVDAVNSLAALRDKEPGIEIDFVHGRPTSPRPKSVVRLRPLGDADPRAQRPSP